MDFLDAILTNGELIDLLLEILDPVFAGDFMA